MTAVPSVYHICLLVLNRGSELLVTCSAMRSGFPSALKSATPAIRYEVSEVKTVVFEMEIDVPEPVIK